jgi:hypothetical protein
VYNTAGLGVDSSNNVYSAGWYTQAIEQYQAPSYQTRAYALRSEASIFNQTTYRSLYGGHGLEVTNDQLIHGDNTRLLFWNHPQELTNWAPPDGIISPFDIYRRGNQVDTIFQRMRSDTRGILWVIFKQDALNTLVYGYRLPLQADEQPEKIISSPLPIKGGGQLTWSDFMSLAGIEVQKDCDCLWLSDRNTHRVFRVRDASTQPVVDIILGQKDADGTQCNQGRGVNFPSQDSLCFPGALSFDPAGNLFVADHNLEGDGNWRLLEFDASGLVNDSGSAVFGIPASRTFTNNGNFTAAHCGPRESDPICGPWEVAFDSFGRAVIGFNGYTGSRFPLVFQNILENPKPVAVLGDFYSDPLSLRFDSQNNLYILDINRSRILIYHGSTTAPTPEPTFEITPAPTAQPTIEPTPESTPVPTRTPDSAYIGGTITTARGKYVRGADVYIENESMHVKTDEFGAFLFYGLLPGSYKIVPVRDRTVFSPRYAWVTIPPSFDTVDFIATEKKYSYDLYLPGILKSSKAGR